MHEVPARFAALSAGCARLIAMGNMQEITQNDLARGRKLKLWAVAAPVILIALPAIITVLLLFLAVYGTPAAIIVLSAGIIATVIGFFIGIPPWRILRSSTAIQGEFAILRK